MTSPVPPFDDIAPVIDELTKYDRAHIKLYMRLLDAADALTREWTPEQGESNPFLHLSMHLAIEEQLSIDQPPGIRAAFNTLQSRRGDRHEALHVVLECLGEMLWRAQRSKLPPDGEAYVDCVRRKAG